MSPPSNLRNLLDRIFDGVACKPETMIHRVGLEIRILARSTLDPPIPEEITRCKSMRNILWNGVHILETVQIVLDKELLQAVDRAARRTLREHLQR
jgi:hypothetical protein